MKLHKFAYKPDASGRKTRTCADTFHLKRDGLISSWISSDLARSQKLQTTFRINVVGFTKIFMWKTNVQT